MRAKMIKKVAPFREKLIRVVATLMVVALQNLSIPFSRQTLVSVDSVIIESRMLFFMASFLSYA